MSEDERLDIIEGTDEDGNRLLLRVVKYFFYNGEEYVLLQEHQEGEQAENTDPDKQTVYVMRVSVSTDEDGEEIEDFEPVDEELAQRLIPVIHARWNQDDQGAEND